MSKVIYFNPLLKLLADWFVRFISNYITGNYTDNGNDCDHANNEDGEQGINKCTHTTKIAKDFRSNTLWI